MKRVHITEELAYGSALDRLTGGDRTAAPAPEPPAKAPPAPVRTSVIKLSVFLSRQEDAYLEGLASTAKFTGGKKLSKTKLIEAMVRAFRNTKLDVQGVKTDEELWHRVNAQLRP
ncbi:MAG: hypothetical protein ABID87_09255 [Chloroflexota bacterium]